MFKKALLKNHHINHNVQALYNKRSFNHLGTNCAFFDFLKRLPGALLTFLRDSCLHNSGGTNLNANPSLARKVKCIYVHIICT